VPVDGAVTARACVCTGQDMSVRVYMHVFTYVCTCVCECMHSTVVCAYVCACVYRVFKMKWD
jgi:hypothetical protein